MAVWQSSSETAIVKAPRAASSMMAARPRFSPSSSARVRSPIDSSIVAWAMLATQSAATSLASSCQSSPTVKASSSASGR